MVWVWLPADPDDSLMLEQKPTRTWFDSASWNRNRPPPFSHYQ